MLPSRCAWQIIVTTTVLIMVHANGGNNNRIKDKEKYMDNKITRPLKIVVTGARPFFFYDGSIRGSDILIIQLLSKKLGFKYNLTMVNNFDTVVKMVRPLAWAKCLVFIKH